ncbi:hypothetical protein SAMN05660461_4413 [Chitinophaga ginsengisegetis]|uniref:Uncharacterized protein n=1 Tax=Chitinophaga ginsengisegetis TaxID=393003 RepID=A0A1T5P754_9BACT|nr:hypothetical protein [Chitinophaga ginsengisegetis]SKD08541.1 hypothetical protein SAMN05660461_4413 [Chitinophaga ginsengisegetis]
MLHKDSLNLLRQQIPIGARHGLHLLNQTNGNVEQARLLFEAEMIQIITNKTAVSSDIARKHLIIHNYDIVQTIASIDEERFTLSQRILRKAKNNKEEALTLIVQSIESTKNIQRKFWLPLEELGHLPPPVYCLLVLHDFLSYEDWESFGSAIYFHSDIVVSQLETMLDLPQVAYHLRAAKKRSDEIYQQYKGRTEFGIESIIANKLATDAEFSEHERGFEAERPLIVDRLYSMVVDNVGVFP